MLPKLLITLGCCFYLLFSAYQVMAMYLQKSAQQEQQNMSVVSLKDTWQSLIPVKARWDETFSLDSEVSDLNQLFNLAKLDSYGLTPDSLQLTDAGRDIIKYQESWLGLSRNCMSNANEGFKLKQDTVSNLTQGVSNLVGRPDISFNSVTILVPNDSKDSRPYLFFDELCIIVRGKDVFEVPVL